MLRELRLNKKETMGMVSNPPSNYNEINSNVHNVNVKSVCTKLCILTLL